MTLTELREALVHSGIENADMESRILFSHFAGTDAGALLGKNPSSYSDELKRAVELRCSRYPLQYILGEVDFYRQKYRVSPECLIPRPDTEILVEEAIATLPSGARFADLCTGSGCIAISVLAERPDLTAVAIDISEGALALCRENAQINGVDTRLDISRCDILAQTPNLLGATYILSNPPYIAEDEMSALAPELSYEPSIALVAEDRGMAFYKKIMADFSHSEQIEAFIFEIGALQGELISSLASEHGLSCRITKDYSKNDRVATLSRTK